MRSVDSPLGSVPKQDPHLSVDALNAALKAAGIVLPSLRVSPSEPRNGVYLIDLGRARADVVTQLAEVIKRGAEQVSAEGGSEPPKSATGQHA